MRNTADRRDACFLEREGARLHYRSEGEAAGPAVLFLHGWALDLRMWDPQVAALLPSHRIVRMDRRGFGASSGAATPSSDASDAHALLDHLDIRRAFVVGMSQGARAALVLAALDPTRVSGLVLDGAPAVEGLVTQGGPDEVPVESLLHALQVEGIRAVRRAVASHPFMQLRTGDRRAHALLEAMISAYRGEDLASRQHGSTQPSLALHRIQVPVLALNGAHDSVQRRSSGDAYCSVLPRCERALVPDAGHLPNLDNPAAYDAVLAGFFRRHAP